MIQCPYCRTPLTESSPACPNCHLDLGRANAVMGPIPQIAASGLTVLTAPLDPTEEKSILRQLQAFRRRFPQCRFNVLLTTFPENFPPATYLFWIFNSGTFSEAEHIRGRNRDLLLGVDPDRHTAGLIVGYGLEPFLSQDLLDGILEDASPLLQAGELCEAAIRIIGHLSKVMEDLCRELPAMLGLEKQLAIEHPASDF